MERSLEQRYVIKFCLRLGKNATETFQMLQKAFKDDCISRSQSGKWHKAFKEGREEVADEPRSGRPTTARTDENVDRVLEVLRTDRRLSIQKIADTLHMSTFVVHGIVTEDLQMRKVCAKLVLKVLSQDQKELRILRCQELLDLIQNEPDFLNSSCAWHTKSSPRPKKARMSKSRIKTVIIVFFDIRGIEHCEFVPQGQTVNSAFYLEVLRRLKRRIARVRTDIKDTVKLHHDNATSHTAFIITNFLARSNTPVGISCCLDKLIRLLIAFYAAMASNPAKLCKAELPWSLAALPSSLEGNKASRKRRMHARLKFPKSVMVWTGVTSEDKTPLVFIDRNVNIDSQVYQDVILRDCLLPWARQHFTGRNFVLQRDWAPAPATFSWVLGQRHVAFKLPVSKPDGLLRVELLEAKCLFFSPQKFGVPKEGPAARVDQDRRQAPPTGYVKQEGEVGARLSCSGETEVSDPTVGKRHRQQEKLRSVTPRWEKGTANRLRKTRRRGETEVGDPTVGKRHRQQRIGTPPTAVRVTACPTICCAYITAGVKALGIIDVLHSSRYCTYHSKLRLSPKNEKEYAIMTKMVLVDGSLRHTCDLHPLGMETDAEELGLKIQGHFAKQARERDFVMATSLTADAISDPQTPAVTVLTKEPQPETGKLSTSWDDLVVQGLACVFAAGVVVHRQQILWPGNVAIINLTIWGVSMTCVNAHVSHIPEERCCKLRLVAPMACDESAWILGDLKSPSSRLRTSQRVRAGNNKVATIGSRVDACRLDRILPPSDRVTHYQIYDDAYSYRRAILIQVGEPAHTRIPCIGKLLQSDLIKSNLVAEIRLLRGCLAEFGGRYIDRASHFLRRDCRTILPCRTAGVHSKPDIALLPPLPTTIAAAIHRLQWGCTSRWDGLTCEIFHQPPNDRLEDPQWRAHGPSAQHLADSIPEYHTYALPGQSFSWTIA
ncbi:hypothetical protein LAZ67_2003808 [Cordylochernes scorpioides]|uniref:Mos1 transposase HTH domain-containing protein n=1 Tax=Cordylochernes scorpioides TaxID=51811 RepID=A0ABY6K3H8_9ARAC|nr:hypothetical protein LAZ67_2003808 [Cordylochernes scorpioides]